MDIGLIRSSSFSQYSYCQMSYYMTYVLGYQQPTQKKALLGTITHKVMEVLANCKKTIQDSPKKKKFVFMDEELGAINFTYGELMSKYFVEDILVRSYEHYTGHANHLEFEDGKDMKFCRDMVLSGLQVTNGAYDPRNQDIFQAEQPFQFVLDKEWAKYQINGEDYYLTIRGTMDLIVKEDNTLHLIDYKGLPLDTKIPTKNGWTTMRDINIGDIIFDINGKQTKVIGKSSIKNLDCYKIIFDDTSEVVCDEEHLWTLNSGKIVNVKDLKPRQKISIPNPLEIEDVQLPIDPYVLGLWLSDGRNRNGEITKPDNFVFEEIIRRGYNVGENIGGKDRCQSKTVYDLVTKLKSLNLTHNKHIPMIYLRSSYSQRLDLLRGLMDGDGSSNKTRKSCVFSNCNKRLAEDVKELLLTLGQRPHLNPIKANGFGKTVDAYHVCFRPIDINPFLLPRKSEKVNMEWGPGRSNYRSVKSIEKINSIPTQCIKVDSQTSTFLCTENMIPTHNTGQRLDWATGEKKDFDKLQKDFQLMLYYYAIRKLFPEYKSVMVTIIFLRDGGPFSVIFEDDTIEKVEELCKEHFETVKNNIFPKPINAKRSDFRCTRLCHFYKNVWPGTKTSMCNHVEDIISLYGIEDATKKLQKKDFVIGFYQNPGSSDKDRK